MRRQYARHGHRRTFSLEKKFGIKLVREEMYSVFFFSCTVGALHRHLMAKLRGECDEVPSFEPLWFEISQAVARVSRSSKLGFFARLKGGSLFPDPEEFADAWKSLESELGIPLPDPEYPAGREFFKIFSNRHGTIALAQWIVENHPERVEKWIPVSCERKGESANRVWTEEEVWDAMCDCIVDVLRVKREEITPDARLVEDLGMD